MLMLIAVVVVVELARSLSRRNDLKRWRIVGREAAIITRAGSMKPQITRGRELSASRRQW
jgi:hypothetical protein